MVEKVRELAISTDRSFSSITRIALKKLLESGLDEQ